jgi:hypothetical protein
MYLLRIGSNDSSALHPTSSRQTLIHTTLCAFVSTLVAAAAEGPSRVSRLFFVHDGDGFLLLALLFVDCCFSANLLRRKTRKSCAAKITLLKMVWKRK